MKKALMVSLSLNILFVGIFAGKRIYYATASPAAGQAANSSIDMKSVIHIDSSKIGKIKKVLILGNSIVRHGPLSSIGWTNNWGMAASSIDSDFVHILIRDIKSKDPSCNIMFENIADFERGFDTYSFNKASPFRNFNADMIIMRISENVNPEKAIEKGFLNYYDSLIHYIDPNRHAAIILADGFFLNNTVNRMICDYAPFKGYTFLEQSELNSAETKAIGQWKDPGIQEHPNNLGMLKIEQSIWGAINVYFNNDYISATYAGNKNGNSTLKNCPKRQYSKN